MKQSFLFGMLMFTSSVSITQQKEGTKIDQSVVAQSRFCPRSDIEEKQRKNRINR